MKSIMPSLQQEQQQKLQPLKNNNNNNRKTPKTMSIILCIAIVWMATSIMLFLIFCSSSDYYYYKYEVWRGSTRMQQEFSVSPSKQQLQPLSFQKSTLVVQVVESDESASATRTTSTTAATTTTTTTTLVDTMSRKQHSRQDLQQADNSDMKGNDETTKNNNNNNENIFLNATNNNNKNKNTLAKKQKQYIILQLRGEMGNHLSGLAHAKGLQWELENDNEMDNININNINNNNNDQKTTTTKLLLRHQTNTKKWQSTRTVLQKCFPNIAPLDFEEANIPEFATARATQKQWLLEHLLLLLNSNNSNTTNSMKNNNNNNNNNNQLDEMINGRQYGSYRVIESQQLQTGLKLFQSLWKVRQEQQQQQQSQQYDDNDATTSTATLSLPSPTTIPIPFLLSHTLASNYMVNRYYDQIVDFLQFNETACCGDDNNNNNTTNNTNNNIPYPDETVFHFRNFGTELGFNRANTIGYSELPPQATAQELLGHLQPGDKVAITTRRRRKVSLKHKEDKSSSSNDSELEKYVTAMTNRGLQVRVIDNDNNSQGRSGGEEDFCFLMRAQKELIGNAASTYVSWAAILGRARNVQLYIYDTPGLRNAVYGEGGGGGKDGSDHHHLELQDILGYQWDHPKLKDRIKFPVYNMATTTTTKTINTPATTVAVG